MGTFTPRTDSTVTSFKGEKERTQFFSLVKIKKTVKKKQLSTERNIWYHVKQIGSCKRKGMDQCLQGNQTRAAIRNGQRFIVCERYNLPPSQSIEKRT